LLNDPNRGARPPRVSFSSTSRSAPFHGSGLSNTLYVTLNSAVVAPILSANVTITSAANRG
jgi:hypothetical protein